MATLKHTRDNVSVKENIVSHFTCRSVCSSIRRKMATKNTKPRCKFGEKCYRKNPQHLQQYSHPNKNDDEVAT